MANSYTINNLVRITGSFSSVITTSLTASVTDPTATSISIASAVGFPSGGNYEIVIDAEHMWVTAGQGTTTWSGLLRGYRNTIPTIHDNGAPVSALVGTATDPSTISAKVKDPTGTITTYSSPAKDSTGNYHQDITPTIAGIWYYEWIGTGVVVAQGESYFIVVPTTVS